MKVNVKWGKEVLKDIEVDVNEPPMLFKLQLFSLTGVPADRQKVMGKGGMLGDDTWGKTVLKAGQTIMMMGTADKLPVAPTDMATFVEDLPEEVSSVFDMSCPQRIRVEGLRGVHRLKLPARMLHITILKCKLNFNM